MAGNQTNSFWDSSCQIFSHIGFCAIFAQICARLALTFDYNQIFWKTTSLIYFNKETKSGNSGWLCKMFQKSTTNNFKRENSNIQIHTKKIKKFKKVLTNDVNLGRATRFGLNNYDRILWKNANLLRILSYLKRAYNFVFTE